MFESDEVKASFFLTTLPDTMDNIVYNLSSRNVTNRQGRQDIRANKPRAGTGPDECTWCKKQKLPYVGYLYSFCDVLKRHKEQFEKAANKSAPTSQTSGGVNRSSAGANGRGKQQKAKDNAADVHLDDAGYDSSTEVVALSATVTTFAVSRNVVRTATSDFRALNTEIHRADSPLDGGQSSLSPTDLTADDCSPPKKRKRAIDDAPRAICLAAPMILYHLYQNRGQSPSLAASSYPFTYHMD
ncbi:hypothetical protein J1614_012196 [Plenodomus biglobosus]|nr:hypothetical protein J1614_012196 [Plenodomus biglobosus]